ncbi:potassium channel subfamily K member 18 [Gouania willdenowi]|uniref:Potassium channel domain-containing protein n=1 Tax=Gouania willdenowi TaxID=441366 RepID=A0A8C5EHL4_GOUWI|nr:potassium channel subfamily K member 18 [Gouania willdenowi]
MSVTKRNCVSPSEEAHRCTARLWRIVPHLLLCLSLVAYAALGALIFKHIEGRSPSPLQQEYHEFLRDLVLIVQNVTSNSSSTHEHAVHVVKEKIRTDFKSVWFQSPERWSFLGSMFFCCTVFTTVGYGEIYPVTLPGKVVCVLYAMMGIPLMLLVIMDVGDFLALVMSRAYVYLHSLWIKLRSRTWSPWKSHNRAMNRRPRTLEDGTFVFSHDMVIREPLDIRQVLQSQEHVRHMSSHLQNNKEIFEKILAREAFVRKGPLLQTKSCPELNQLPPPPKGYVIWDFTGLGDGMETLDVPFILILFIVFAYICFGGLILPLWEKQLKDFDSYYFCFITLTTIGFGDIIPHHPNYLMITSLFIIVGMAIMSMAFKLSQTRIVSCYQQFIKFISRGNVETLKEEVYN